MDTNTWVVTLEEDPETGDLILPLPPEFCDLHDWQIGDILSYDLKEDQSCIITNVSKGERQGIETNKGDL